MRTARQTPSGARPRRDDRRSRQARFRAGRPGRLLEAAGDSRPRGMAATSGPKARALQNPAYRPADAFKSRVRLSPLAGLAHARISPGGRDFAISAPGRAPRVTKDAPSLPWGGNAPSLHGLRHCPSGKTICESSWLAASGERRTEPFAPLETQPNLWPAYASLTLNDSDGGTAATAPSCAPFR